MPPHKVSDRRQFLGLATSLAVGARFLTPGGRSTLAHQESARQWLSQPRDHFANGTREAVAATTREASEAALWALDQGGNACDAYIAAALTQTVVEHGLTSLAGGFSVHFHEAATSRTTAVVGPLGPAANEPYDFERGSPVTQTGRAMPVPGFLAGVEGAHRRFGKLAWEQLFQPAIRYATDGFVVSPMLARAAADKATRTDAGKALWTRQGRLLQPGDTLTQTALGKTLAAVANGGAESFYTGAFAAHYVRRARADNGRISMEDMAGWRDLCRIKEQRPEGSYRGDEVLSGGLNTYALHLAEALDLRSLGPAKANPESLFRQYRIMEEVFFATREYSQETHAQFVSADYARQRADFVLTSPLRKLTFDAIFNTCFLVVRDRDGNVAWGTHSINTPTAFGAGILVDGVYAAHAMNRGHVHGTGGSAPGIATSFGLVRNGNLQLVAGSPGFGFVHGPWQFGTGITEWGLTPVEAMNQPRFGLPTQNREIYIENHYDKQVLESLSDRGVPLSVGKPSTFTGLVGGLVIAADGTLQVVQDGRSDGYARAN